MKCSTNFTTSNIVKRFWLFAKKTINSIETAEKIAKQGESRNDLSYANEWYSVSERLQKDLTNMFEVIFGYFSDYEGIVNLSKSYQRSK